MEVKNIRCISTRIRKGAIQCVSIGNVKCVIVLWDTSEYVYGARSFSG